MRIQLQTVMFNSSFNSSSSGGGSSCSLSSSRRSSSNSSNSHVDGGSLFSRNSGCNDIDAQLRRAHLPSENLRPIAPSSEVDLPFDDEHGCVSVC